MTGASTFTGDATLLIGIHGRKAPATSAAAIVIVVVVLITIA